MEKINKVCGVCGSDEITLNAAVKWDVTDQRYRLSMDGGEYDDVWCEACDTSTFAVDMSLIDHRPFYKPECTICGVAFEANQRVLVVSDARCVPPSICGKPHNDGMIFLRVPELNVPYRAVYCAECWARGGKGGRDVLV